MAEFLSYLVLVAVFIGIMIGLVRLRSRMRRRGIGVVVSPLDEIYNPAAHRFRYEIQEYQERLAPNPSADDQFGRIRGGSGH